jgi:hypothetical protein
VVARGTFIKCWLESLKGGDHSEDVDVDGEDMRMDLGETGLGRVD